MNRKLTQNLSALSLFLCLGGLIGCSPTASKPSTTETKTVETSNKGNGNVETKTTDNKSNPTTASADKIGVPECDNYIEKYEACITGKVPEAARQQMKNSCDLTRKSWKDLAANPQTKSSLASACKQSQEAAKQAMTAYQCDF